MTNEKLEHELRSSATPRNSRDLTTRELVQDLYSIARLLAERPNGYQLSQLRIEAGLVAEAANRLRAAELREKVARGEVSVGALLAAAPELER